jgi:hypothetical protein
MMNTKALVAILAGLMGGAFDPRLLPTERRTVKVRPANYTHPMVVSSPAEINAHNGRVALAKQDRSMQRMRDRRQLIGELGGYPGDLTALKNSQLMKLSSLGF